MLLLRRVRIWVGGRLQPTRRFLALLALAITVLLGPALAHTRAVAGTEPWPETAKLIASDSAGSAYFGFSVALSGDTALVGAYRDGASSGSAYVFVRSAGVWTEQAKLLASDGAAIDFFGYSVALSGDTALIGSFGDDDSGESSGSAYVFVRAGGVWTQQAKLRANDGAELDTFGWSVALSGDTALVGAYGDDDNGTVSGSAYVFVRSGDLWIEQAKLLASDGAANDAFGFSVALSAGTALVGASRHSDNGAGSGSAYVFMRLGDIWSEQAELLASDGASLDSFGRSVALSDDAALVGALGDDDNGNNSGSAYVFVRSGDSWREQTKLLASDGSQDDEFGISVALSGDTALVGAQGDDDNGGDSGSGHIFVESSSGVWREQAKLVAGDGAVLDLFGSSVALSGDTALVGASGDDHNGNHAGSAYIFGHPVLFADGFESGDASAWTVTVPGSRTKSVPE